VKRVISNRGMCMPVGLRLKVLPDKISPSLILLFMEPTEGRRKEKRYTEGIMEYRSGKEVSKKKKKKKRKEKDKNERTKVSYRIRTYIIMRNNVLLLFLLVFFFFFFHYAVRQV